MRKVPKVSRAVATDRARAILKGVRFMSLGDGGRIEREGRSASKLHAERVLRRAMREKFPSNTALAEMVKAATIEGDAQAACSLLEMASNLLEWRQKLPDILIGYVVYVLRSGPHPE